MYPDDDWAFVHDSKPASIQAISVDYPLTKIETSIRDNAQICSLAISPDGSFLASFCSAGTICIWDTDTFERLLLIKDDQV
jgi:WD40 repeat protein